MYVRFYELSFYYALAVGFLCINKIEYFRFCFASNNTCHIHTYKKMLDYDSHNLWFDVNQMRPSDRPSPDVAHDGCTYQLRSLILVKPSFPGFHGVSLLQERTISGWKQLAEHYTNHQADPAC